MGEVKLTKAKLKALAWFAEREEAHLFGAGDPTLTIVRKLVLDGLVERRAPAAFGFSRYRITPAGRSALTGGDEHDH